jgi:AraC family transcriptional regulator, transcriptional activator FtrA
VRKESAKHHVAVAVPPGSPIFELSVPCEVFGIDRPDIADPWYDLRICPTSPATRVAGGFVADQPGTMADLATADTVVVPGCTTVHEAPPPQLLAAVREAHRRGARIVGICSGTFVLAHAGLLDHRRATTHWMHAAELARRFPTVTVDAAVLYVEDEGMFTSAGTAAAIDLCLELVRQDHGAGAANELARRMVTPPHRDGGQAQFVRWPMPRRQGDALSQVLQWAEANLDHHITVADLARRSGTSQRTLVRRFHDSLGMPPQQWLLRRRLQRAQQLLETTSLPIDRVADRSGMGSGANLRQRFAEQIGVSPHTYRTTFGSRSQG